MLEYVIGDSGIVFGIESSCRFNLMFVLKELIFESYFIMYICIRINI